MRHLIVGLLVAVGATLLNWQMVVDDMPLANFWGTLNLLPIIIGILISGNGHAGPSEPVFMVLQFIQWLIVGFILSRLLAKMFRNT